MTLTLREDATVIIAPGRGHAQGVSRDVPLAFNRSKGHAPNRKLLAQTLRHCQ